jgi:hypothetical protein
MPCGGGTAAPSLPPAAALDVPPAWLSNHHDLARRPRRGPRRTEMLGTSSPPSRLPSEARGERGNPRGGTASPSKTLAREARPPPDLITATFTGPRRLDTETEPRAGCPRFHGKPCRPPPIQMALVIERGEREAVEPKTDAGGSRGQCRLRAKGGASSLRRPRRCPQIGPRLPCPADSSGDEPSYGTAESRTRHHLHDLHRSCNDIE